VKKKHKIIIDILENDELHIEDFSLKIIEKPKFPKNIKTPKSPRQRKHLRRFKDFWRKRT